MKGFPKVLKTAQDVKNCKAMVDAGQLQATRPSGSDRSDRKPEFYYLPDPRTVRG